MTIPAEIAGRCGSGRLGGPKTGQIPNCKPRTRDQSWSSPKRVTARASQDRVSSEWASSLNIWVGRIASATAERTSKFQTPVRQSLNTLNSVATRPPTPGIGSRERARSKRTRDRLSCAAPMSRFALRARPAKLGRRASVGLRPRHRNSMTFPASRAREARQGCRDRPQRISWSNKSYLFVAGLQLPVRFPEVSRNLARARTRMTHLKHRPCPHHTTGSNA